MAKNQTGLIPTDQQTTDFYGDEIITAIVESDGEQIVYVPLRPICDFLGLNWSAQFRRVKRNIVLNTETQGVAITATPSSTGAGGGPQEMVCLPLDYLNGWLFGINAERVKPEIQEQVIRYQRECYKVLANHYLATPPKNIESVESSIDISNAPLEQVRNMWLAMARLAQEQIELDDQLQQTNLQVSDNTNRLDKAASFFKKLDTRVGTIESKLSPGSGQVITMEQASELSGAVKTLALKLGEISGKNEFGGVYGRLYQMFGITGYKLLPASKFSEAMAFLNEWYASLV